MAKPHPTAFERVFPARDMLRGAPLVSLLCTTLGSVCGCALLVVLSWVVDLLVATDTLTLGPVHHSLTTLHRRLPFLPNEALTCLLFAAAVLWLLRAALHSLGRKLRLRASLDVGGRLRAALHRQVLRLGPGDLDGRDQQHVLQLFTKEIDEVRDGVSRWIGVWDSAPLKVALLLGLAAAIHPSMVFICGLPLAFCWYVLQRDAERRAALRDLAAARSAAELRLLTEQLQQSRTVRGYGMEDQSRDQFDKSLARFQQNTAAQLLQRRLADVGTRLLSVLCIWLVLMLVGTKVLIHEMSFADAALFLTALGLTAIPLQRLWNLDRELPASRDAAGRLFRYLDQIPPVSQAVGAKFIPPLAKLIELRQVTYIAPHGGDRLLDEVTLRIRAGSQVAIVSLNPLEPLALASLLPRFIEQKSGQVLFDGEDIAWGTLESLRAETVIVGGGQTWFTGTVLDNIRAGHDKKSLNDVTEAAKLAHAHNFILKLPQGYETVLGEHGEQLDPGQAFRLALARAALRNPALLIIQEPDALLDDPTKSLLDDAYQRLSKQRTVIFLPARMSTLRRVDEIILLNKGKIELIGNHADMVRSSPLYRHWEYLHFNEFRHGGETAASVPA